MLPEITKMRLGQLESNVARVLLLINDYEVELLDESDPGIKNKYRRRIENLRKQYNNYESELLLIQEQLTTKQPQEQISTIKGKLEQIDEKLNWIGKGQAALYQSLLSHFTIEETNIIKPMARQLEESQLAEVESVLGTIESTHVNEEETKLIVRQLRQVLALAQEKGLALPNGNEAIVNVLNHPTIDTKHALKISIPIIPFVLSYESELGLGAGFKVREAWDRWRTKTRSDR